MGSLDTYLEGGGFKIDSKHPIIDWETVSREIYAPQFSSPQFTSEFNTYLWLTKNFFGNGAIAYKLSCDGTLEKNIEALMGLKSKFRRETAERLDSPINILVNLDKLARVPQPLKIGKPGILKIGDSPLEEGSFQGRWDYFFFKYVHSPDNRQAYERENQILNNLGVYNYKINKDEWAQMVQLRTLISLNNHQNE